jgi:hypothetical protein
MWIGRWGLRRAVAVVLGSVVAAGCTNLGPYALDQTRLHYNEVIKRTTEEQLLLNIVRLRYTDTPSSLAVSAIAAQFERSLSLQLTPFFVAGDNASFTAVLPQVLGLGADRPTVSLTPVDDQEFTRKLFTPLSLDGVQVKLRHPSHVEDDPDGHDERLGDQERGGPKEAREGLGFDAEPVIPEDRGEMYVGSMEAERGVWPFGSCEGLLCRWCRHRVPGSLLRVVWPPCVASS